MTSEWSLRAFQAIVGISQTWQFGSPTIYRALTILEELSKDGRFRLLYCTQRVPKPQVFQHQISNTKLDYELAILDKQACDLHLEPRSKVGGSVGSLGCLEESQPELSE
jgi:hypothetical protein